ncbi:MAG TPA: tetratricopeptide repeat protein, partial [Cyclobacteriaceae bacterium]|nr:tetratricopeptide repeat protein [Cyclobacteriaceae bacterium]
ISDTDPYCMMAYWGLAMCNFHPLWAPPSQVELKKGLHIIQLARSIAADKTSRESEYVEAIAAIYDNYDSLNHRARVLKFESATEQLYKKYPDDNEAAIFYSLALRAASDPLDKTYSKQKKAGEILNAVLAKEPNHPGIAHYIIHTFDYPELASMGLTAARRYASIAAASAHAQHMPSHIFTRLGLWDESIQSNLNSISAAQCYAQNTGIKGHWDEELHGMDYLAYAYLQKGDDDRAIEQIEYLKTITEVFPSNFKDAYTFAAMPSRSALERKDWKTAAGLELAQANISWDKYPWESAHINFARLLGAVHSGKMKLAKVELTQLQQIQNQLSDSKEPYRANLVFIQVKISEGWITFYEGNRKAAVESITAAADLEDKTEKDPVTPGEVLPARELLGDLYMEMNEPAKALEAYEATLKRRPNRFNALYGAGLAAEKSGDAKTATQFYQALLAIVSRDCKRLEIQSAKAFVNKNM